MYTSRIHSFHINSSIIILVDHHTTAYRLSMHISTHLETFTAYYEMVRESNKAVCEAGRKKKKRSIPHTKFNMGTGRQSYL